MRHDGALWTALHRGTLATLAAVFLVPFLWVLLTSVKRDQESIVLPPRVVPVAMSPTTFDAKREAGELSPLVAKYGFPPTGEHYVRAVREFPFLLYMRNTLLIVVLSTIGTVLSCAAGAYAFGCLRWPDRDWIFAVVLGTMLLPSQITIIPQFMLFRSFGWIDTVLPLVVPAFFGVPFTIFLLRQFFVTLPRDLFEAARIDGAGELRILAQIVVPLSKPAMLAAAIFAIMGAWNDFFGPLIYLSSESTKTLAVGLQGMVSENVAQWGLLMACGTMMIAPVVALFFVAQRHFIEGIAATGMKG
jgi:multiple sugar transport system permease protein